MRERTTRNTPDGHKRFFRSVGSAVTLAIGFRDGLGSPLSRLPPLPDTQSIPTTLLAAALTPFLSLPPGLVGTPMPPTVCCILACRAAIPHLGIFGLEELLAAFQQAAPLPRRLAGALP